MLTVAIASHNGASTLRRVLEGYAAATPPPADWRLVLVDNASTDDTSAIIERFAARLPIVHLHQPRRGKNCALNLAISHFCGDLVVMSDDDAIPAQDFLVRWADVPERHPEYAIFGGTVLPEWPAATPRWLLDSALDFAAAFAVTPPDHPAGPTRPEWVFGPNMAVRREVFERGFRFDESVGPSGRSYRMGSETSFLLTLHYAGFRARFFPEIVVHHIIRARQLERRWIRQRALNFGRGAYLQDQMNAAGSHERVWRGVALGRAKGRLEHLPRHHIALLLAHLRGDPSWIARAEWYAGVERGYLKEALAGVGPGNKPPAAG